MSGCLDDPPHEAHHSHRLRHDDRRPLVGVGRMEEIPLALIEISPDFKLLLKELRRIARALELNLEYAYGVRVTPIEKEELKGEPPDVTYSDDETTLKREIDEARRRIEIDDSEDAEVIP